MISQECRAETELSPDDQCSDNEMDDLSISEYLQEYFALSGLR